MKYRKWIKYPISWAVSTLLFIILANYFLEIDVTTELVLAGMGYGLLSTGIFALQRRGHTHFGHIPTIVGFNLLIIGGGLLFGAMTWDAIDKVSWWTIPDVGKKTILGVMAFVGFLLLIFGLKETGKQWWWLRPGGGKRPF